MSALKFWQHCQSHFEKQLNTQQFNTWIRPLRIEVLNDVSLRVLAPNQFHMKWVKERFWASVVDESSSFNLQHIELVVAPQNTATNTHSNSSSPSDTLSSSAVTVILDPILPAKPEERKRKVSHDTSGSLQAEIPASERSGLDSSFSFDNFVTGKANQLARAAAIQVAENPGIAYNPLFVYGGVGLGKTHLIQSIGNAILQHTPNAKIRYTHAESYVSDVVKAYQHKAFDEFKRRYRSLDMLIVDDIQFFGGKSRTQEEFFYLFNALTEAKKQVIITCDTYPKEIEGIEERLISRFGWGLTVALEPPETEMRVAILLSKAKAMGVHLHENVAFYIAKLIYSNVRELEGALKRIVAFARLHGTAITLELTREALKDLIAVQTRQVSLDNIQKVVADYYKIKVAEMYSKKRSQAVARPRQMAMFLAKELTQLSLPEIGSNFGGRDHTTVLHACRKIIELRDSNPTIAHDLTVLFQVLRS
ncbi:MAG: chromosomal replication initiator protein DnaA [Pseudomonadota bacterium]